MQKFRQADEGFKYVFEVSKVDEQVSRLKEWAAVNQTVVPMVRWGVQADKADWGLPEGMPELTKLEEDLPGGLAPTTILMEWRRVKMFTEPTANVKNLPKWKQEQTWLQVLEGVHPREAEILTAVKDGTLLNLYPKLEKLMKPLGIDNYVKPKKTRKKKEAKVDTSNVDFTKAPEEV